MLKINNWAVDADDKCYIVGKLKTKKNKDGEDEEYISAPRYFSTLGQALSAILESERRGVLSDDDHSLNSLMQALKRSDEELLALFGKETP